jgi:hypothetical protein
LYGYLGHAKLRGFAPHIHVLTREVPFILNIAAPVHPCTRGIPFVLNIAAPVHPCTRGIPFILNIKKPCRSRVFPISVK